jgi:hypothetical protein
MMSGGDCDPDVVIITGTDADHVIITEPLCEIRPAAGEHDAQLRVEYTNPQLLGVEGALQFLKASQPNDTVVFDARVDQEGETIGLPPGSYTLRAYYRPCDANCGYLDPPGEFCMADATLEPDATYRLVVDMTARQCEVR